MTKYRVDFEKGMVDNTTPFETILSAAVLRADQASFEQATTLGASLSPGGSAGTKSAANQVQVTNPSGPPDASTAATDAMKLLSEANQNGSLPDLEKSVAFTELKDAILKTPANTGARPGIGLEPTTVLRQKKTYHDTLNAIRRNNMGDDTADSAGYGLVPRPAPDLGPAGGEDLPRPRVQVTFNVRPEFEPDFLPETFHNLVINDLVEQIGPLVLEMVRTGVADEYARLRREWDTTGGFNEVDFHRTNFDRLYKIMIAKLAIYLPTARAGERPYPISPNDLPDVLGRPGLLYLAAFGPKSVAGPQPRRGRGRGQ